jgi:hypothetical protein
MVVRSSTEPLQGSAERHRSYLSELHRVRIIFDDMVAIRVPPSRSRRGPHAAVFFGKEPRRVWCKFGVTPQPCWMCGWLVIRTYGRRQVALFVTYWSTFRESLGSRPRISGAVWVSAVMPSIDPPEPVATTLRRKLRSWLSGKQDAP